MAIDLTQFHQAFFDESFEHLAGMEAALLELDPEACDDELVNTIFRSAHSIKGAAGTLGFKPLVAFTHVAETLLDEVRDHQRQLDTQTVDVLLRSVDVLRGMVEALMAEEDPESAESRTVLSELETLLGAPTAAGTTAPGEAAGDAGGGPRVFRVTCVPEPTVMRLGNDMLGLFRVLGDIGSVRAECDPSRLPAFETMDPLDLSLSWTLEIETEAGRDAIAEVFEWVEDECELRIDEVGAPAPAPAPTPVEPAPSADPPPVPVAAEPAPAASPAPPAEAAPKKKAAAKDPGSIRVALEKVDALVNLVGELVITQGMLGQTGRAFDMSKLQELTEGLDQLERNTRELQEAVMAIRMLPVSFAFSRIPRMVRDIAGKLGKEVKLTVSGEGTEVDKTVLEQLGDPLVHLVRNALDHGIEAPDVREAAGKPAEGNLWVHAAHQGGKVVIDIKDDGGGIPVEKVLAKARERGLVAPDQRPPDDEVRQMLFHPGFSTASQVSDLSGRGVGLDVVQRNIKELGGEVLVSSEEGEGTCFSIRLPLTMAILEGQLVRLGAETFIIPLMSVVESLPIDVASIRRMSDGALIYKLRESYLPLIDLCELIGAPRGVLPWSEALVVIVEASGRRAGIIVDDLAGQQQVVIKSLETNFRRVTGISGATVLGDGSIGLILDANDILRELARQHKEGAAAGALEGAMA